MSPQEIFDTVANHLRAQGRPSLNGNGHCAYRGPDGLMCAAGVLIPDENYKGKMEGMRILPIIDGPNVYGKLPYFFTDNMDLINQLQKAHDNVAYHTRDSVHVDFMAALETELSDVAKVRKLTYTKPI